MESGGEDKGVLDLSGQVHQLPCSIKFTGPCSVSHYFKPKPSGILTDGLTVSEAYFRGRKLQGATISLPDGYSGFLLGKTCVSKRKYPDEFEESFKCWEKKAKFENITYWNHDSLPSKDDTFLRTFHWLTLAKAVHSHYPTIKFCLFAQEFCLTLLQLHKPVTDEDLAASFTSLKELGMNPLAN